MSWLSNFVNFVKDIPADVETWFGAHRNQIAEAINDAQTAAATASGVAAALGEPSSVTTEISKVSDGLNQIGNAIAAEASAATLQQQAAVATGLTTGLVNSGDLGVKNAQTQQNIDSTVTKVQNVATVLSSAAAAAPAAS